MTAKQRLIKFSTIGFTCLLLGIGVHSSAQTSGPNEWGVLANGAHNDCPDNACPSYFLGLLVEEGNGGAGSAAASFNLSNARGTVNSSVAIDGGLSVPSLAAFASSNPNSFVQTEATGIQGYTYTAANAGTITLSATLTGNITNPDNDEATGLTAQICLIPDSGTFFFTDAAFTCLLSGITPSSTQMLVTATGAVNQSQNIAIDLTPGDDFYVVAVLTAAAAGSAAVSDASNTLTMEFTIANHSTDPNPATTLTPAFSAPINVPMLPLGGLLALFIGIAVLAKRGHRSNF